MAVALTFKMTGQEMPNLTRARNLAMDAKKRSEIYGNAARITIRDHLNRRDTTHPNRLGGDRTHFWNQVADSTSYRADNAGATVSINHVGIRLQWQGGTVEPVNGGKFLTIPAIGEAHGHRAREFDNLKMLFGKNGPYALAEVGERATLAATKDEAGNWSKRKMVVTKREMAYRKSQRALGIKTGRLNVPASRVVYWLVKRATIQPHPDVLPTERTIVTACIDRLISYLQRQRERIQEEGE